MDMKDLHERTGAATQRAEKDLPEGYEIQIFLEQGAGTVVLNTPAIGDHLLGESISEFDGDDFAYEIENAIDYAIRHKISTES